MLFFIAAILALVNFAFALPQAVTNATNSALQPSTISPISAVPTTNCVSDNFIQPWVINNLVIISPFNMSDDNPAHMSFSFYDPNEELQLVTVCIAMMTDGNVKLANGGYVGCEDKTVRFQVLNNSELLISRWYKDPCKGTPPYDSGIAYGQSTATFETISSAAGSLKFQQQMNVNVTRMS